MAQEERSGEVEAGIGATRLQAKEHHGVPGATRS